MRWSVLATALLFLAVYAIAFFCMAGCALPPPAGDKESAMGKVSAVVGKGKAAYQKLGETREETTTITISPAGTTTQIMTKVTGTSAAADLIKSLGGMAVKGAK